MSRRRRGSIAPPPRRAIRDAFEAAVRPHYANLVRRLVLVLGDEHDAEDVAQDAYLKAYRSWDRFDGTDVRAWLYTIALAARVQPPPRPPPLARGDRPGRAAGPGPTRRTRTCGRRSRALDVRTRSALLLNVVDGYTQAEIARMLSVPEGTVASWISRGRAILRRELDPDRPPD